MEIVRASFRITIFIFFSILVITCFCMGIPCCLILNKSRISWKNWLISRWAGSVARIFGLTMTIIGTPPQPPFFLVSNHLSYIDILPFWKHLKTTFVAKSEIQKWPFFGFAARMLGIIFIERSNKRDITRINELISQRITRHQGVILFPEGTSSKGAKVLPFKSSLLYYPAHFNNPVYCASLSYKVLSDGKHKAWKEVCWWGDMDFLPHLWNVLKIKSTLVEVHFADMPFTNNDRKILADSLRAEVQKNFKSTFRKGL